MDPWGRAARLDGWRVDWAWRPQRLGVTRWGERRIILDITLSDRLARCVLSHEVIHAERGPSPRWAMAREEEIVSRESARRLIPLEQLGEALAWTLCADEAAEELWIDRPTLLARLRSLTPAERAYLTARLAHHLDAA